MITFYEAVTGSGNGYSEANRTEVLSSSTSNGFRGQMPVSGQHRPAQVWEQGLNDKRPRRSR